MSREMDSWNNPPTGPTVGDMFNGKVPTELQAYSNMPFKQFQAISRFLPSGNDDELIFEADNNKTKYQELAGKTITNPITDENGKIMGEQEYYAYPDITRRGFQQRANIWADSARTILDKKDRKTVDDLLKKIK